MTQKVSLWRMKTFFFSFLWFIQAAQHISADVENEADRIIVTLLMKGVLGLTGMRIPPDETRGEFGLDPQQAGQQLRWVCADSVWPSASSREQV